MYSPDSQIAGNLYFNANSAKRSRLTLKNAEDQTSTARNAPPQPPRMFAPVKLLLRKEARYQNRGRVLRHSISDTVKRLPTIEPMGAAAGLEGFTSSSHPSNAVIEIGRQMSTKVAGVVGSTIDQRGFSTAHELCSHKIHPRR
jgi:hypothetical protein